MKWTVFRAQSVLLKVMILGEKTVRAVIAGQFSQICSCSNWKTALEITPTDKSYKVYAGNHKKFYFQHLSVDEKNRFIDIVNMGKVKFAYPGYFYVLPYFVKPSEV